MISVHPYTAWTLWVLYLGVLFSLSELPGGVVPMPFAWFDKVLHFMEYIPLPVVTLRAFATLPWKVAKRHLFVTALVFGILYAASDEIHQITNPTRQPDPLDFLADCLGILLGTWLVRNVHRKHHRARPRRSKLVLQ